ncbi:MAG: SDR family NAD(P)-dependent oxidoreductase [Sulfuricaulis sp.]|nr:SDR family NAD(P)-dependent oxidoreductase [Sulfuricaulis sp.]
MKRLTGKRAIITGAGSGIGRASALRFAEDGAQVLVVGRTAAKVDETAAMVRAAGGIAIAMALDAAVESNVEAMVARCISELGGLEVFFANAATWVGNVSMFDQTVEQWQEVLRVNLIGSFLAAKHAGRHMRAQGAGSIIFTSSVASLRANAGDAAYSASKAGVNNLAQLAANELYGSGVRVNAILPGLIETEGTQVLFDAARARGVESKIGRVNPLKRAGRPEEIAAMAAFLASDDASYVNGQAFAVDGGVSSTHPFGRLA